MRLDWKLWLASLGIGLVRLVHSTVLTFDYDNSGKVNATVNLYDREFGAFVAWMMRIVTPVCGTVVGQPEITIVNPKFSVDDVVNFLRSEIRNRSNNLFLTIDLI